MIRHQSKIFISSSSLTEQISVQAIVVEDNEAGNGDCFSYLFPQLVNTAEMFHVEIPFVIMTSDDTHIPTLKLLESNYFFGTKPDQEKVACLDDNDARIALDPNDKYMIQTKPHGHGDVHSLLYNSGLLNKWRDAGLRWVVFYQDTNGLLFKIHQINWSSSILTYHENFVYSFDKVYQSLLICFLRIASEPAVVDGDCFSYLFPQLVDPPPGLIIEI
ncbi:UDP-sugar pyrophosphorylase [Platanthera guangdongensis]|uniref:UTP-monosaccharide-1-phosphate uridylyltransferase n=1 Tax=Platanthera guangdongensis TaxID=2320717 RepID=A0ABR2MC96_9ASPA